MRHFQVTGNEYISLPTIREEDGAVEGVTFLYMLIKGMLEMRGDDALLRPSLHVEGETQPLRPKWQREECRIPSFISTHRGVALKTMYLTPVNERGFVLHMEAENHADRPLQARFGAKGRWDRTLHETNETAELPEGKEAVRSGWNHAFIYAQRPGIPLFAFAPCAGFLCYALMTALQARTAQ